MVRRTFSWFASAIHGPDGEVDAGYLGLAVVIILILGVIPGTFFLVAAKMLLTEKHDLMLDGLGTVIQNCGVAFGSAATGVGLFRWGDKPRSGDTDPMNNQRRGIE